MRGQSVWLWGAGLLLLAFISFAVLRETPESVPGSGGEESATPPKQASTITVSIASSNTKQEWLHAAVKRFNELAARDEQYQVNGKPIYVVVLQEDIDGKKVDYRSGVMVSRTASGEINPTVISPGDESWLDRFREAWKLRYGTRPIGRSTPVLVRTPLVLAMWQSRAKTLGCWPDANPECTWQRIRELASDQGGWKRYDHPEWGRFKLGYGYFGKTNSGTLAVTAMCSVAADKTEGDLTMDEVDANSPCGHLISDVEAAKVHSGKSDRWLLERMVAEGAEYLDAVVTYESNVIAANRKYGDELREPLVSMYPQDGTFIVGHPYAILDGAPWVSEEQAVAADVFGQFLLDREQQASVLQLGLRPADSSVKLKHPIEMALGANPTTLLTTIGMPEQLVVERLGEVWHEVKKHAAIAIVFDKSGSMAKHGKITAAVKGAEEFVRRMDLQDTLIWLPFDGTVYPVDVNGTKAQVGETLLEAIGATTASGDTALYDAVLMAFEQLEEIRDVKGDSLRYGIVVLSDGQNTAGNTTLTGVKAKLRPQESDPTGVQIHTICLGDDCDTNVLMQIAKAAHGKFWQGKTRQDMTRIYGDIATYY